VVYHRGVTIPAKRVKPSALVAIGLAAVLASIVCGCASGGVTPGGPLSTGNGIDKPPNNFFGSCIPGGRPAALGYDVFTSYGHATVTLSRVALVHPRNQRIIAAYAAPGTWTLGQYRWPPPKKPPTQPQWKDRQPVHGYRVPAGKSFDLVLDITAIDNSQRATSRDQLVYYRDSSGRYAVKTYASLTISANTHSC
jgi:hypothetical protein